VEALHHRLAEVEKRRTPRTDAARDALVGELLGAAHRVVDAFDRSFDKVAELRRRAARAAGQAHRTRTTSSSTACRASVHVTDATDWRVEYPFVVLTPDSEAEMAGLVRAASSWA
jgi:hypothetical protein